MEWYIYPLIVAAGFLAGFINTLAGSGSLITLPMLIFAGLPATVANGTNRVAVLLQCSVAVGKFKKEHMLDLRRVAYLTIPAVLGAIIGAQIAADLNELLMRKVIGVLMVIMLGVVIIKPRRWLKGRADALDNRPGWLQMLTFFGIGIYGGFIQAGVGIFLLAGLVLSAGYELVRANAFKNFVVLCFTAFALVVFILNDQVNWVMGLVLAVGNMLGAWVAARMAIQKGAPFVRYILIAVIIISALMLLGIDSYVRKLI